MKSIALFYRWIAKVQNRVVPARIGLGDVATKFAENGMLVYLSGNGLWLVVDRYNMRDAASRKNLRYRYQVLNFTQSQCILFRGKTAAIEFAKHLAKD